MWGRCRLEVFQVDLFEFEPSPSLIHMCFCFWVRFVDLLFSLCGVLMAVSLFPCFSVLD
ncbi:hypothetical protein QL285_075379 [Trifolium repens]|nr:hypothetical protein QL285_075379 [Trifolium repens]